MNRVIIADVKSNVDGNTFPGHGRAVAEHYLKAFQGSADVHVAGGPIYSRYFKNTVLLPYNAEVSAPGVLNKWRVLSNLYALFKLCRNDTLIIQSCAVVTAFLGIALFKRKETKVFMIQYDADGVSSRLKRFLFYLAKRKIQGIICPHEEVGEAYGLPYCVVPDYICSEVPSADDFIPYSRRQYDFCMLGLIWRSKGFVEAAKLLAGTSFKVLVAGQPSAEEGLQDELESICRNADNIELQFGYLDEETYDSYIRQSRYCILNYSECYSQKSSGVVFDFLFRGVPIIGSRCRTLQFVAENALGRLYGDIKDFNPEDVLQESVHEEFMAALQKYYQLHLEYRKRLVSFVI